MSKINKTHEPIKKGGYAVHIFSANSQTNRESKLIFVVQHPIRGWIGVTTYRERNKCIDFLQGRRDDLQDIMGIPALDYELGYNEELLAQTLACRIFESFYNKLTTA